MGAPLAPRDPVVGRDGKISQNWLRYFDTLTNIFRSVFTFAGLVGQPTDNANLAAALNLRESVVDANVRHSKSNIITLLGDSLTYGSPSTSTAWGAQLSAEFAARFPDMNVLVDNKGVPGDNTTDVLARLTADVLNVESKVVVLQIGSNDSGSYNPVSLVDYEANMRSIITKLHNYGKTVVVMVPPGVWEGEPNYNGIITNAGILPYQDKIRDLAAELHLEIIDNSDMPQDAAHYGFGGTHLTVAGYTLIYQKVMPVVSRLIEADDGNSKAYTDSATAFQSQDSNGDAVINVDTVNSRLGIGTTAPKSRLHIHGATTDPGVSAFYPAEALVAVSTQDDAANASFVVVDSTGTAGFRGNLSGVRARGTLASPTVPLTDDLVFSLIGSIYDGAVIRNTADINFAVDGAVSSNVAPQRISFRTKTGGSGGFVERLTIKNDGKVGISNTSPGYTLDVTGTVNATAFRGDGSALTGIAAAAGSAGEINFSAGSGVFASDPAFNYSNGILTLSKSGTNTGAFRLWVNNDSGTGIFKVYHDGTVTAGNVNASAITGTAIDGTSFKLAGTTLVDSSGNIATNGTIAVGAAKNGANSVTVNNSDASSTGSQAQLSVAGDIASGFLTAHGSGRVATRYGLTLAKWTELLGGASSGSGLMIGTGTAATPIVFGTNGAERARILSTGDIQLGTSTNNTTVESDGTLKFTGTGTVFNDLNISALMITTAGATVPTLTAINSSTVKAHGFTGTGVTVNEGWASLEILHDYKEGTDITPHVHWMPTTTGAGNIKWQMDYYWLNNNDVAGSPTTITLTAAAGGTAWKEQRHSFTAITGTGKTIGSRFMFRIYRDPADAADTYGDTAILTDIGIHYEIDTVGSRQITTK